MDSHTKRIFQETDWNSLDNTKILEGSSSDKVLVILEVRGSRYELLNYDWYMIMAIIMTDGFSDVDSDYVISLRISIREDYQKFNSEFLDILHSYSYYSLDSIDTYIEIFDDYSDMLGKFEEDKEFRKWFLNKKCELEKVLKKIPQNKRK